MCGIAGMAGRLKNPVADIEKMNCNMIRRGPDAGGYWLEENDQVVFGHRRLSILDLSENGAQPMHSLSGRYVIIYNGEIYNAGEIKKKLEAKTSISYRGTSDTEVLLNAIEQYGLKDTLMMCRGMFALAVYDRKEKRLQLARDRMGEKPLYYGWVNGSFVFASDLNSIKALEGFNNPIRSGSVGIFLQHGYIPAPYSIYEDIYKLDPGTILAVDMPFEKWEQTTYFDIAQVAKKGQESRFSGTEMEACEELEKRLKRAISGQMLSDVPLGAFLSGGIDSTLVVSLMQSLSSEKIKTFTIGFEEEAYNEASYAKEAAALLGTDHTEMYVGYSDVIDLLPCIPEAFGEPFADSSQLPTMLVSKMTKEHVTVALSGDAGDEFFCGYNSYLHARDILSVMQGKLPFIKGPLRPVAGKLLLALDNPYMPQLRVAGRCFTIKTHEDAYRSNLDDDIWALHLLKNKQRNITSNMTYKDGYLEGIESNLMLMDMKQYLPDDILVKVDRAGMFYSLETRIPILDADVMEFAWTLPDENKMSGGVTKKILKQMLYQYVPKEMMDRPKKGFSVPVSLWLRDGQMREWAETVLSESYTEMKQYLDVKAVDRIWKDYQQTGNWTRTIWHILMLGQWLHYNGK